MEFGDYLKKLREENKLSLRQLALYSKVSASYLSQIESGARGVPKPEILSKLHKPLKVSYEELMKAAGYIEEAPTSTSNKSIMDDLPEDLKELFGDPEIQIAFKDIPGTYEEKKKEIIDLLRFIKFKEAGRRPGDKQGE